MSSDRSTSFLALLASAGVNPRIVDGRLVACLASVPPEWESEIRHLLVTYRVEIAAEIRQRDAPTFGRFASALAKGAS